MKKIGIFLAFAPNQKLCGQGIGRLLAFMLSGILHAEQPDVVIASPAWYKEHLIDFLKDANIDHDRIILITTPNIPYLVRIKNFLTKYSQDKKNKFLWITYLQKKIKSFFINIIVK